MNDDRISVGAPYFNRMTMPIGLTLLFLMAVAPVLPWRKASGELLRHRLHLAGVDRRRGDGARRRCSAPAGCAPVVAFGLGGFAAGSAGRQIVLATRRQGWRGLVGRANGGMVVHLGVVIIAVAFAASGSFVRQAEFTLEPGQSAELRRPHPHLRGPGRAATRSAKIVNQALVRIDGTGPWGPALNQFTNGTQTIGTPSVRSTLARRRRPLAASRCPRATTPRSRCASPSSRSSCGSGSVAAIMALGTLLAVFPGRRRNPIDPVSAPLPRCPVGLAADRIPIDADADDRVTPRRCRYERHSTRPPSDDAAPTPSARRRSAATPPATPPSSSGVVLVALIALLATRGTNEPDLQQASWARPRPTSAARPSTADTFRLSATTGASGCW